MGDNIVEIKVKTLTPLWTGGVDGTCDRIHETGIIGSLRGWYEAIVRGLGGYACDPTSGKSNERCSLDYNKFQKALDSGKTTQEALYEQICPVCQLFGCTGWKKRFRLQVKDAPTTPLHFRTSVNMNKSWLRRIFGGETQNIAKLNIFYGEITFKFVLEDDDRDYIWSQLIMLFDFVSKYGGLGAKLQHGFGQTQVLEKEPETESTSIGKGLKQLSQRIHATKFFQKKESVSTPYNLQNFISLDYDLPISTLRIFMKDSTHIGNNSKNPEDRYVPCAFDIRYKGKRDKDEFGMRRWLEDTKEWEHKNVNTLMGVSQKKGERLTDDDRASSRLYFGMPYKLSNGKYHLRIFGFSPSNIMDQEDLKSLCEEYIRHAFDEEYSPMRATFGKEIIRRVGVQ